MRPLEPLLAETNRPARIVLAEDDRELRVLLADVLRRDGYDVVEAADGYELAHFLDAWLSTWGPATGETRIPFDLVISDVRMPGWDGLKVLRNVRFADWAMPFVLITAFGDHELHAEAQRLGALAVFDKPFDVDDLRTLVLNTVPRIDLR